MLIREYPQEKPAMLRRRLAAGAPGVEPYLHEDGAGGLVLCTGATLPPAPVERTVDVLFTGGRYGRQGGEWLFFVGLWTPRDFREEFLAWYSLEHMPILLECRAWSGCRFVEQRIDEGCQFFAMHQLWDRSALDSAERRTSRSTPWFGRFARYDWFDAAFQRSLYRRVPQ